MIRFTKETIAFWKKLLESKERLFKFLADFERVSEKVDGIVGDNRTIRVANPFRGGVVISGAMQQRGGTAGGSQIGVAFRVALSQTGGSAGNKTTPVSFTYTVTSLSGAALATVKAPEWPSRSENGLKVAATAGLAYYDANGAIQIAIAFERSGTGGC